MPYFLPIIIHKSVVCFETLELNIYSWPHIYFRATWVIIHGVKYQKRGTVVHQHSILSVFLRIEDIFIMANGDTFFACKKMHTSLYSKHLHWYEIASMNNNVTINYDELLDYHPLDIYEVKIGDITRKYIRMRDDLADCENYAYIIKYI